MSEIKKYENEDEGQLTADRFFNFYDYVSEIKDPEAVYEQAVWQLTNLNIDRDNFFGAALSVFHRIGKPMPRMPIVVATLMDEEITESEARYLLGVLVETGSSENYTEELNFIRQKYPSLNSFFN